MPPDTENVERPDCFGDEDTVMPRDAEGFIQPQEACSGCSLLRDCMRAVLDEKAEAHREKDTRRRKALEEASSTAREGPDALGGVLGFLKRWFDRKLARGGDKE